MKDRIKEIRKSKNLNQTELGDILGVSRYVIANIEIGRVDAPENLIRLIIKEFGVNETWLRTGDGSMYAPKTKTQEIADFAISLLDGETDPFKIRLMKLVAGMTPEQIRMVRDMIRKLAEAENTAD